MSIEVMQVVLRHSRLMSSVQRKSQVVIVSSFLILRHKWQLEGACAVKRPERIEPGLVNIWVRCCLKVLFLKKSDLFLFSVSSKLNFTWGLSEWFVFSSP
jgi:hypothetical protein